MKAHLVYIWIMVKITFQLRPTFFSGSHALFTESTSTFFSKNNFNTGSYGTIHTFKNYFDTMFSVFSNKQYTSIPLFSFLIGAIFDSISIFERFINLLATQPWWMGVWPNNPWATRGLRSMLKAPP